MNQALLLKKNLKAIDNLPHNGIMSDMITFTHKSSKTQVGRQQSASVATMYDQGRLPQSYSTQSIQGTFTRVPFDGSQRDSLECSKQAYATGNTASAYRLGDSSG